jgi:hypothetical protein
MTRLVYLGPVYLASSCYDLESAIGGSLLITAQIKLLEDE